MLSLNTFLNRINAQWLIDILKENKLYTVYQPIVKASDPGSIYGYECLLRAVGSEEDSINPEKLFSAAEDSELIFQLDRDARITAIENINSVEDDVTFFINFRTSSIYDPEYCLRSTIEAMEETDINPSHFTFEVVESKNVKDKQFISGIIEKYRDSGVNVSLDDLGANEDSLELMKELEPDYVKFESDLTKVVRENSIDSDLIEPITTEASELGILTMAKGIESEYEHNWFKERGVDLLQGNYFYTPSGAPEPQHSS
jgi:EAL domain-containing protein (putative c-di-GMP-specific phosphodiesterase class I)